MASKFISLSLDYFCLVNDQGYLVEMSDNWVKTMGYSKSELLSRPYMEFIHPEDRKDLAREVKEVLTGRASHNYKLRLVTKENGIVYLNFNSMYDPKERLIYGIANDISDLHHYQKNIKESEKNLKEAQRLAKIGSWKIELSSKQLYWSEQMFCLVNRDPQFAPLTLDEYTGAIHPSDQKKWKKTLVKCIEDGSSYKIHYRLLNGGENIWVEEIGTGLTYQDGRQFIAGTCQDITEKILKEEELEKERAKVVQASKLSTIGEVASGVAHEINNPLAIIQGYMTKLEKQLDLNAKVDNQELKNIIHKVSNSIKRMSKIISGMRNLSREASQDPFDKVKLSKILDDTLNFCQTRFENNQIDLIVDLQEDPAIECREVQVSQVLLNLLNNAFDVLKDPEVKEKWIKVEGKISQNGHYTLSVSDSGPGIPAEIVAKIFDPFYTSKGVGKGTGLGLSISLGIIESHQGSLYLQPGSQNTTFEINLPLKQKKVA